MPFSEKARSGLRSAIEWNPQGAKLLLSILKEFPAAMKRKDDPYGSLHLILSTAIPTKRVGNIEIIDSASAQPPFPERKLEECKSFGDEWKAHRFTKAELAEEIERILAEIE